LEEYACDRGWKYTVYQDTASGAKDDRPGLQTLLDDARKRKFKFVLVWKFDRFARSTIMLLESLEEFRRLGIAFVSFPSGVLKVCRSPFSSTTKILGK
jgi:DNA invertase Pin-like site-specific DNA recombinase